MLKIVFIALLAVPAGCDVKDPIYNTPHPDQGMVTLTTDWSRIGTGLTAPDGYTVTTGDGYSATLTGTTNRLDHRFDPGTYRFLVYNTPAHITVAGTTATVAPDAAPPGQAGNPLVHNAPEWLFTATADAKIEKDTDHTLTAAMQQQVRELTLIIQPTGGSTERIESIDGYLSGAAGTLNLNDGTTGAPSDVALTFAKITSGAHAGKWSTTVRLLGTAGTEQTLTATIRFADGSPADVPLESKLTTALASFNDDKRTPLTLDGQVAETPTGAGFTATIKDWEKVSGGPAVAD